MARRTVIDPEQTLLASCYKDDKFVYHAKQNDQFEHVKDTKLKPGKELRHLLVPMVIYQKAIREGWQTIKTKWKKWLTVNNKLLELVRQV